jgi:hypothetical protein
MKTKLFIFSLMREHFYKKDIQFLTNKEVGEKQQRHQAKVINLYQKDIPEKRQAKVISIF